VLLPRSKSTFSPGSPADVKFSDRRHSQNHAGLHSLFFAAGHRSHSSSEKEKVTPSQCEEASLRVVLARSLGALERGESASFVGRLFLLEPRRGGRWGGRSAWRAIASPTHLRRPNAQGEARPVAGPAPCDVTPRRRSEATSTGARRMAWGGVGYQMARNGRESLACGRACGSGGPQARATPIAAPSKGEARRVGGGPRRQEPQRVAVGDKQQRGRTPRRLVETKRRGERPNGGNRSLRGCSNGQPGIHRSN